MNKKPLVSIIIPFYNRPYLLFDVLTCVQNQSYTNIEVIVVDDGSEIPIFINEDLGLDIKFVRYELNKGAGYARKKGRELAKGNYVCYLDSDDWWSDNFIEECVKTIESDLSLGMVYTNTVKVVNGIQTSWRVKQYQPTSILPTLFLNTKRLWSTPSCLWKKDVSLAEHWQPLRNHEDFLHDINSSRINNKIKFVAAAQTFNNHSADYRIPRDGEEVRKALNEIIKIKNLSTSSGISFFYLNKIYKSKLKIKFKDLPIIITLPLREFRLFSYKWCLFYGLVFLNIFSIKPSFQKRKLNKLK